jgi:hypothetical protein
VWTQPVARRASGSPMSARVIDDLQGIQGQR